MDRNMRRIERRVDWLRFVALALVACVVVTGCRHRRSSLRPTYLTPGSTYVAAPAPTAVPDTVELEPALVAEPTDESLPAPRFEDDFGSSPSAPSSSLELDPIDISPPASPAPGSEPDLELDPEPAPAAPRDDQTIPSGVGGPPDLSPPQSLRDAPQPRPARLTGSGSLREQVQARADDPLDLVQPPKADRAWGAIVLHHSGAASGGYAQLDRQHRANAGLTGCGYHFVIGNGTDSPDGTIEVTRRWSEQKPSQHCRGATDPAVNDYGIAICLVGDFETGQPTERQLESTRLLVRFLAERYRIDRSQVATHDQVDSTTSQSTPCPGGNLHLSDILGSGALSLR